MSFNYTLSKIAAGALTRFRFVAKSGTGCIQASAPATSSIGISQFDQDSGDEAAYVASGVSYLEVDGSGTAITEDSVLTTNASGVGVVAVSTNRRMARALEASTTANSVIRVVFIENQTLEA